MGKGDHNPLLIRVREIAEGGLKIGLDLPRAWLTNIPEFATDGETHLEGGIRVEGQVLKEGDNLRLQGEVSATLATLCTRCGEPVTIPLSSKFETALIKGAAPELSEEVELTPEDVARGYYDGTEVDLAPFFQEELALQVPIQTLCQETCRGLCPQCGANWNLETCACGKDEGDSRLAALKNLKLER